MGVGNIYRAAWPQTVWEDLFSSPKPELEEGMYSYIMLQYAALVATDSFSVLIKGKMVWGTCGSSLIFCDSPKLTLTKTLWNINMSRTLQSREQNHSSWLYTVPGIGLSWRKQDRDWPRESAWTHPLDTYRRFVWGEIQPFLSLIEQMLQEERETTWHWS